MFHVADDVPTIKLLDVLGVIFVLLPGGQLGKVLLSALDFVAEAGKLVAWEGIAGERGGFRKLFVHPLGGLVSQAGEAGHGFVLAVMGVHGLAAL